MKTKTKIYPISTEKTKTSRVKNCFNIWSPPPPCVHPCLYCPYNDNEDYIEEQPACPHSLKHLFFIFKKVFKKYYESQFLTLNKIQYIIIHTSICTGTSHIYCFLHLNIYESVDCGFPGWSFSLRMDTTQLPTNTNINIFIFHKKRAEKRVIFAKKTLNPKIVPSLTLHLKLQTHGLQ